MHKDKSSRDLLEYQVLLRTRILNELNLQVLQFN